MLAHGVEEPDARPRRDLSRLPRLRCRGHGAGSGQEVDRRTDGGRHRAGDELPAPMAQWRRRHVGQPRDDASPADATGKKRAWLSPIVVAALHWFAATAAAKSAPKTDADADPDAFHNGAGWRAGRTAFDDDFLGGRPALRRRSVNPLDPRYIDSFGRRYIDPLDR